MTKDEMIAKYCHRNYDDAQADIAKAMANGEHHIYYMKNEYNNSGLTSEDVDQLIKDGFTVEEGDYDEYKISW